MSGRSRHEEAERRRRRTTRMLIGGAATMVVLLAVLVAAITSGGSDDPAANAADAQRISMIEMAFEPDPIDLDAADALLRVTNDGMVPHSLVLPDLGKGTPDLEPGAEMTLDLTDQEPGAYYVYCDVPGHREAGMETTLNLR